MVIVKLLYQVKLKYSKRAVSNFIKLNVLVCFFGFFLLLFSFQFTKLLISLLQYLFLEPLWRFNLHTGRGRWTFCYDYRGICFAAAGEMMRGSRLCTDDQNIKASLLSIPLWQSASWPNYFHQGPFKLYMEIDHSKGNWQFVALSWSQLKKEKWNRHS